MSRCDDPAVRERARQLGGRIQRAIREFKRREAGERNAWTWPERRRKARTQNQNGALPGP